MTGVKVAATSETSAAPEDAAKLEAGNTTPSDGAELDNKGQAIVSAAGKAFLTSGFAGASMDQIAAEAGVSKRTVYNRYRSKDELFAAVITDKCETNISLNVSDEALKEAPETFLRRFAEKFLDIVLSDEAIALHRIINFEVARFPELGRIFLESGPYRIAGYLCKYFERQVQMGRLEMSDPERAAWQLVLLLHEPLQSMMVLGQAPDDLATARREQIESGLDAFFKLYGKQD